MLSLKVAKAYVAALEGAATTFIVPTAQCIGHVGDVNTIDYGGGFGWDNLDSYPLELTVAELRARWGGCNAR